MRETIDNLFGQKSISRANIIPRLLLVVILLMLAAYGVLNYNALLNADSYAYLTYARDLARGSLFGEPGFHEIFKDYWSAGSRVDLHSGLRHMIDGRIYHGIELGYPMLLAVAILIGGPNGGFFLNPILLLWLVVVFYLAVRLIFYKSPYRDAVALLGVLIMLLIPSGRLLSSGTKIMRDIPPLTFVITGYYFLMAVRNPDRYSRILVFIGAFFLGLASLIRFHYLIMAVPFFIYLISTPCKPARGLKRGVSLVLFAILGLAFFALPVLIRDLLINGDIFFTARILINYLLVVSAPTKLFSRDYFSSSGLWYLDYLYRVYGPGLIFLGLIGLIFGWKSRSLRLLLIPAVLLHFLLFAFFRYHHSRYLLPFYLVISGLVGYGIIVSLDWILSIRSRSTSCCKHSGNRKPLPGNRRETSRSGDLQVANSGSLKAAATSAGPTGDRIFTLCRLAGALLLIYLVGVTALKWDPLLSVRNVVLVVFAFALLVGPGNKIKLKGLISGLLICVTLVFSARVVPAIIHPFSFNFSDAGRLKNEIEKHVPPDSLILSTRYLKQNIDYYTDSYSMNIHQPGLPWGLSIGEAIRTVMNSGAEVFVLDNKGKRKAYKFLPVLRENFDLEPVARWRSDDLKIHMRYISEREYLNLYRVLPWEKKEVGFVVSPASGAEHLLIIDIGKAARLSGREWLRLSAGDRELRGEMINGVNYIYLASGPSPLNMKLESDRPLPAEIPIRYLGEIEKGFRIEVGEAARLKDWRFLDEGFFNDLSRDGDRTIFDEGGIRIPVFSIPGKKTVIRLRVRNNLKNLSPLYLTLSLDEETIHVFYLDAVEKWREIDVDIPVAGAAIGTAYLQLTARPEKTSPRIESSIREKGILSLDWVEIEWIQESER